MVSGCWLSMKLDVPQQKQPNMLNSAKCSVNFKMFSVLCLSMVPPALCVCGLVAVPIQEQFCACTESPLLSALARLAADWAGIIHLNLAR